MKQPIQDAPGETVCGHVSTQLHGSVERLQRLQDQQEALITQLRKRKAQLQDERDRYHEALKSTIAQLDEWANYSVQYGWSTHQVDPMRKKADELRRILLP